MNFFRKRSLTLYSLLISEVIQILLFRRIMTVFVLIHSSAIFKNLPVNSSYAISTFGCFEKVDFQLVLEIRSLNIGQLPWLYNQTALLKDVEFYRKSLKIPKGQSESIYRRTENTMAKRKVQKDKQRSLKHTYKTKDRVTRSSLKTGGELRCSGRVGSSCSTIGTRRGNLVTNPVISRE